MKLAQFWKKLDDNKIQCLLCERKCIIPENQYGFCKVRKNIEGNLYTLTYGKLITFNEDPIEKKPLYHFLPGSKTLSLATPGCNFRCLFCQNWTISQVEDIESLNISDIDPKLIKTNLKSISFTYTEPTIYYEYAKDIYENNKDKYIIFVSNGYYSEELTKSLDWVSAFNIDVKGPNEFYEKICLAPKGFSTVIRNVKILFGMGKHIELTTLVIEKYHDENFAEEYIKTINN